MDVSVVIPFRTVDDGRVSAMRYVVRRLADLGYGLTMVEGDLGPWSKPSAILEGLRETDGEVVVVHDADAFSPGLEDAIAAVVRGEPWAVPHHRVYRLTAASTARVLAGADPDRLACLRRPYRGTAAGGIVVLRREVIEAVPPDPRFTGWGGEDAAWRDSLRCLVGMEWRGEDPLYHLHHSPSERSGRHHGSEANRALVARYAAARRDPEAMRVLLAEHRAVAA